MKIASILCTITFACFFLFIQQALASEKNRCLPGTWKRGADGIILVCYKDKDGRSGSFEEYWGKTKVLAQGEIATFRITTPYPDLNHAPSEINILVACGKQTLPYPEGFGPWGIRFSIDASEYVFIDEDRIMMLCADTPP